MVNDGEYLVDFDKSGLVRARFVIANEMRPWQMVDFLDGKVKAKFQGAEMYSIKRHTFELDARKSQWSVRWTFPKCRESRKIEL